MPSNRASRLRNFRSLKTNVFCFYVRQMAAAEDRINTTDRCCSTCVVRTTRTQVDVSISSRVRRLQWRAA